MAPGVDPPTLDYLSRPIPGVPRTRRGALAAAVASIALAIAQFLWCAAVLALWLYVDGDVAPVGRRNLLLGVLLIAPVPPAAALGLYAVRYSTNRDVKVAGTAGLFGAACWFIFLFAQTFLAGP